nr:MAG TPA: hypothetical protein [Caudoviricetes sp.]
MKSYSSGLRGEFAKLVGQMCRKGSNPLLFANYMERWQSG